MVEKWHNAAAQCAAETERETEVKERIESSNGPRSRKQAVENAASRVMQHTVYVSICMRVCVCVYSILLCWRNVCGMLNKNNEKTEGVNDWLFCWLAPQTKKYKTLSFIFKQAFTHIFLQYRDWKPAHTHSNTHRGSCVCSIIPQAFLVSLFFSKTSSFRNWEQTQW